MQKVEGRKEGVQKVEGRRRECRRWRVERGSVEKVEGRERECREGGG